MSKMKMQSSTDNGNPGTNRAPCGVILNQAIHAANMGKIRVVFLDRDGVINVNRDDYVKSWDEFEFIPGAKEAIKTLNENEFWVIIVTNQSPIGRGIFGHETLNEIHKFMLQELSEVGAHIDAIYYCPHRPDDNCECRKPKPGLILKAAEELNIDLTISWLIGDSDSDLQSGKQAGCKVIKISDENNLLDTVKSIISSVKVGI